MEKNKKYGIIAIVLLLAVGFAAVSTSLIINGNTKIGTNEDDFNVYFSDAYVNETQDKTVITTDTTIDFTTELKTLGSTYTLDYDVTNGSKNYDADVEMTCTNGNEYLSVVNDFDDETNLSATKTRRGKLTLKLIKSYAGDELEVNIKCTINATAVERTSIGIQDRNEIGVVATDENNVNLNAYAYEITGNEEEELLNSLVETGYIESTSEVVALIEVKSDSFDNVATTIFDLSGIASEGGTIVILHFNEETQEWEYVSEEIVDANGEVTADFTSYSPVAFVVKKDDGSYHNIYKYKEYAVGEVITIANEQFNVISQTEDTVTMLAKYNLNTNYRQSTTVNKVTFSNSNGWEYAPGPKEIDIQDYDGNAKTYINQYVSYLKTQTGDTALTGNLITLAELKTLGCLVEDDYSFDNGSANTCKGKKYASWLVNGQHWWTRSVHTDTNNMVFYVHSGGDIGQTQYNYGGLGGFRPVITISKETLKNV